MAFCSIMATSKLTWMLLIVVAMARTKPLNSSIDEAVNEIDRDKLSLYKDPLESQKQQRNSALPTSEESIATTQADTTDSAAGTVISTIVPSVEQQVSTVKPGPLSWFLTPFTQKVQFSPQSFLQDRLVLLKDTLNNLGISVVQNATGKQLGGTSGLVHFVGPTDSGFYTNRLEPAGFLGGNGWFANKGGILGGPGAILSTGSLLTDYPTPYRK